ncbi:polyprenyl synthetase family protein [Streptomyces mobaraensis]|uniref:Polyprenyl synthetase family protein n=1 Tax=Streptomyces mobaraensis TaxID=35621 RepID=A0A5N5WB82_STRMB|nr:polyprenyl synthetase family protein [Streptomyces mobaraensis]
MDGPAALPSAPQERAQDILEQVGVLVTPSLREAVERLPSRIRHLAGCHFGWWEADGTRPAGKQGKGLRPALVVLSCQGVGGDHMAALPAAVAVELVHNASLLHDDIIDGDRIRRGRPALWAAFGIPAGILAGDALFFLAAEVLLDAGGPLADTGPAELNKAVQNLIEGEYADVVFQDHPVVSVPDTSAMAQSKTGALTATSCALGALAAGAHQARVEHLRAFGAHLGAAFQLTDDLLDVWGHPEATGKPRWSDLAARKKTGPIAYALNTESPAGRALGRLLSSPLPLDQRQLERAVRLMEETGARTWALSEARRLTDTALRHLRAATLRPAAAAALTSLTRLATERDQ